MGFGGASQSNALLNFQMMSNLASGERERQAYYKEAALQREQASLFADEAEMAAIQKQREVRLFREDQAHKYLAGGVLLDGSPLAVLDETRRLGDQEVAAIRRSGAARAKLVRLKADNLEQAGMESLLTRQSENTITKLQADQQAREQKAQRTRSLFGIGMQLGSALLRR